MATCCGSAGGERFIAGHVLSSTTHAFTFPAVLGTTTENAHLLLGTTAYAALPGAPAPDYLIPDNFFSINGDIITFSNYDMWTFGAGVLPTDGTTSLNKNPDDISDTPFRALNSPTNLFEQTGTINAAGGPPGVPDGTGGTTPVTVASAAPDGSALRVFFDVASCTNAADHHILYGQRGGLPAAPGGTFTLLGSVCRIGNASPYDWNGVPPPDDGAGLIWFLLVATDAAGVEGSWGVDGSGNERHGAGNNGASGTCALVKSVDNTCGHASP